MKNYTEKIAHIGQLRLSGVLSIYEQDLYLYLLNKACSSMVNTFPQSTNVLVEMLGVSKNAICIRRQKLVELGLLNVQKGTGRFCPTIYTLLDISVVERVKRVCRPNLFVAPTLDQIQDYCRERGSIVNPNRFYQYYQSRGWRMGRSKMGDWQQTVQMWEVTERTPKSTSTHSGAKHVNAMDYEQF